MKKPRSLKRKEKHKEDAQTFDSLPFASKMSAKSDQLL